ncbi:MAG: sigma-E factor negative regulatory protein [Candidatus Anaerobiospirillum pullicola]|uniref:Sigma-E factor negative regulatory protein n=1 Tax=Candidatus Anaerobiospirillum pullicola TaxID=2838451 RepID=A0A948TEA9_9GAMM|nr:sigma-E factor negative regulatory protein [Candidatus Anaerobiospirillum pullicola]
MQQLSSKKYEPLLHASELFDGQSHQQVPEDSALLASAEVKGHMKNWALIGSALRGEMPAKIDLNFADKVMARLKDEEPLASDSEQGLGWVPPCEDDELPSLLQKRSLLKAQYHNLAANLQQAQAQVQVQELADQDEIVALTPQHTANVDAQVKTQASALHRFFTLKRLGRFVSQAAIAATVAVVAIVGLQTYNAADPVISDPAATVATTTVGPVSGLSLASYQNSDNDVLMHVEQMPSSRVSNGNETYHSEVERQQKEELERINLYVQGYVLDTAAATH